MFYLPRICEHCLNPSCVASCPSGAMYKRAEDGIVLVDQDRCRGWRMCVTGCPYKKVYFNHRTGKAEKCTFCYPRVEVGLPTVCSRDVRGPAALHRPHPLRRRQGRRGRVRADEKDLYEAQLGVLLDPHDPEVIAGARAEGIPEDWIEAARRSPIHKLIKEFGVALPLHPEYRTMPMVWYIPPLSPVVDMLARDRARRRGRGQPVRRHRRAAHPGGVPRGAVHRRRPRAGHARAAHGWPRCARTCAASTSAGPRRVDRHGRRDDRRRDRTTCTGCWPSPSTRSGTSSPRRTPSRATQLEELGVQPRLRGRPGHERPVRRGVRAGRPGGGGELPRAARAGRRATSSPTPTSCAAGSTCSTGTARAPGRAVPPRRNGTTARRRLCARRRVRDRPTWSASVLLDYPDEELHDRLPTAPAGGGRRCRRGGRERLTRFLDHAAGTAERLRRRTTWRPSTSQAAAAART